MQMMEFENVESVGIAWDELTGRVWVCLNGECVFRAKTSGGRMKAFPNTAITQSKVVLASTGGPDGPGMVEETRYVLSPVDARRTEDDPIVLKVVHTQSGEAE